jgi:FkbM family methyltransferase
MRGHLESLPKVAAAAMKDPGVGRELWRLRAHWLWFQNAGIETVVDVGAHVGLFSAAIKELCPGASLHAFEPQESCFALLSNRLRRYSNSWASKVAVGERAGEVRFYANAFSPSSSVLPMAQRHVEAFPNTRVAEPTTVQMRTLDEMLAGVELRANVLMKIDVQGYELQVLRGGAQILERTDYVLVEMSLVELYKGQPLFREVTEWLWARNFDIAGALPPLVAPNDGSFLQIDVLFRRRRTQKDGNH